MVQRAYAPSWYIGRTRDTYAPVFYCPITPAYNNCPTGIVITGQPGSGKTNFGLTMTAQLTIAGGTSIVVDHKGDFLSLIGLKDEIGSMNLWNLGDARREGFLDPFRLTNDKGRQLNYALTTIGMFVGGLDKDEESIVAPIIRDVADTPSPTLTAVVQKLRSSPSRIAFNLGNKLGIIKDLPFARVAFASQKTRGRPKLNSGLTVIATQGLEFPKTKEEAVGEHSTSSGRLATGVLYLIAQMISNLLHSDDSDNPKLVFFDEAWALVISPDGARLIKELALLGRSKGLALVLATQQASHLQEVDISSAISTWFAFNASVDEAPNLTKQFRLPEDQGFEGVFTSQPVGSCVMKDFKGRVAPISIDNWNPKWAKAFDTNPLAQRARRKEQREESED